MKAVIVMVNHSNGMVAAKTYGNDFSTFELTGGETVSVGGVVSWEGDTVMGDCLIAIGALKPFKVFFQNHWVPQSLVRQQLGL
jgi:hypothetical protein